MVIEKIEKTDGRKKNGGKRQGSGRKPSVDKLTDAARKLAWNNFIVELAESSWPSLQELLNARSAGVRLEAHKLVLAYAYGKPRETHDVNVKDPIKIKIIRYNPDSNDGHNSPVSTSGSGSDKS